MSGTGSFGPFTLDRARRQVTRGGSPVPVGHRGYLVLEALFDADGAPVSRSALLELAWPGMIVEEGNLSVLISSLRKQLADAAEAMIVTVPRFGYRLVAPPQNPSQSATDFGGPPSIAVLPFANHGSIAEDGYFADGVVEDIITALSRFKSFAVVSRGASFALRDRGADVLTAAAHLGVRYALEGSIRRSGDRLRLNAQLFDAASRRQLWGERYEGGLADIFAFQDRITESVVGVVEPAIRRAEIDRARRKPAANLDAYDLFLQARPIVDGPGTERDPEALALLQRAAELDPKYALARAYAACVYEKRISHRALPLGADDAGSGVDLARHALALGADDPLVRALCGWVLFRLNGDTTAMHAVLQAAEENPNDPMLMQLAASVTGLYGLQEDSIHYHARALALSPGAPEAYQSMFGIAASNLILGNNEAAIEWALKSLATFNEWMFTFIALTCAYTNLGRMDEALAMLKRVRELSPHLTIRLIIEGAAKYDAFADAVVGPLRKAGLPES
jgi:TolB-like protein